LLEAILVHHTEVDSSLLEHVGGVWKPLESLARASIRVYGKEVANTKQSWMIKVTRNIQVTIDTNFQPQTVRVRQWTKGVAFNGANKHVLPRLWSWRIPSLALSAWYWALGALTNRKDFMTMTACKRKNSLFTCNSGWPG